MKDLKNWFEIWISNVIDFITNDENSNRFDDQTDTIFENFQKSKMIHVSIWNCQYWKFCRKIDWFFDSNIDVIIEIRKNDRFARNFDENFENFSKQINDSNSIEKMKNSFENIWCNFFRYEISKNWYWIHRKNWKEK